jgi:cobalt-factor III methyltransferase
MSEKGTLYLVGFGPGDAKHLTYRAKETIQESDVIVGYATYVNLVAELTKGKEIISTGMTEEIDRAKAAIKLAEEGKTVSVISSGDAGVYGMAGLCYEVLFDRGWVPGVGITVEVVPGVTAMNAVAALSGAPIMHDFASISMSDLLTPWTVIEKRIIAAAEADFVVGIYNPQSKRRNWQLKKAQEIFLEHRDAKTPVSIIKSAYRDKQNIVITTLDDMCNHEIGMLTTIIVGNSNTFIRDGIIVTPRGYQNKYLMGDDTGKTVKEGQKPGFSLKI